MTTNQPSTDRPSNDLPSAELSNKEQPSSDRQTEAPMLGDHLAMDLLNTEARSDGQLIDFWQQGQDVLRWLAQHNIVPSSAAADIDLTALLTQAKALRELTRQLTTAFKTGTLGDITELNTYLHAYHSAPHLQRNDQGQWTLNRIARGDAIADLLGPVAEAVAQLLVENNATLVKQCEHPDCVLWFYDRTKAHKRRWCSMALCGNRYKAAQFRKKNNRDMIAE